MVGVEMRFTLDDRDLVRQIEGLAARGSDLSEPLDDIGQDMVTITTRAFEESRTPEGVAWLPSAAATREGRRTLIDRGVRGGLMGSLSFIVSAFGVVLGTNMVHAAIHQFGGTIQRQGAHAVPLFVPDGGAELAQSIVTLPARAFIGAAESDVQRWIDILADYLAGPSAAGAA